MARIPYNFSWVVENEIAGCANMHSDLEYLWLKEHSIKHILSLNYKEHYPDSDLAEIYGLKVKVIYIEEFEAPNEPTKAEILKYLREIKLKNEPMVVHCRAGNGRTGVVLAMYMMLIHNKSALDAIAMLRSLRPWSIETSEQEKFVCNIENEIKTLNAKNKQLAIPVDTLMDAIVLGIV